MKSGLRQAVGVRFGAAVLTAVLGTLTAVAAFFFVLNAEFRYAEHDLQTKAKNYRAVVNDVLGDTDTVLHMLAAYMLSGRAAVQNDEFTRYARALKEQFPGLRDVGWAPHVAAADRDAFERSARLVGIEPHYHIIERGDAGRFVTAGKRRDYYPVLYSAQLQKSELLGIDLTSSAARATVRRALVGGESAATPPLHQVTAAGPQAVVVAYLAVDGSRRELASAAHPATGIAFEIYEIRALIEDIVAKNTRAAGLDLYLFDPAESGDARLIDWRPSVATSSRPPTEQFLRGRVHWEGPVSMIDQRWTAIITPSEDIRLFHWSWRAVTTLFTGLTMTAMIVAYLVVSQRRTRRLEELTTSLRETTDNLNRHANRMMYMARHDALTGLPNRTLFAERIAEALERARRDSPLALMFLDLDHFKAVNDTLGHDAGDRLLCAAAERINGCLRDVDTVARLGGDEFAIILEQTRSTDAIVAVAERLIREVSAAYSIADQSVVIGVSIGIAIAADDGATAERLLREADVGLYDAKAAGRGTFRFFEPQLGTRVEAKLTLESDLRRAIEENAFEVHYQPIVNLADNVVAGFEALVRWNHPQRGNVPPDEFIPLAQERGLIVPLGLWVLQTACRDAAAWPVPVKVAVNLSPQQFKADGLLDDILDCLGASGLPPQRLEIEITEAAVLEERGTTLAILTELRALGIAVAFDDFGTGFSSLSSLLRFPFDKLKVDRSFLAGIDTSTSALAIVRAIVGLGANLGLVTTGEGIETAEQLAQLRRSGCTEGQGFLFAHACPNGDVPHLLRTLETRLLPVQTVAAARH